MLLGYLQRCFVLESKRQYRHFLRMSNVGQDPYVLTRNRDSHLRNKHESWKPLG